MDPSLLDRVLLVGFAARLTRLAVVDDIADPARGVLVRWTPPRFVHWTVALLTCPYCIGFWISVVVVASFAVAGQTAAWRIVAGAFALAYVTGHLVARLDADPEA
ncbi:MAG: DUF1360 domain-containing protein [Dermatophilaceae bacterium]